MWRHQYFRAVGNIKFWTKSTNESEGTPRFSHLTLRTRSSIVSRNDAAKIYHATRFLSALGEKCSLYSRLKRDRYMRYSLTGYTFGVVCATSSAADQMPFSRCESILHTTLTTSTVFETWHAGWVFLTEDRKNVSISSASWPGSW